MKRLLVVTVIILTLASLVSAQRGKFKFDSHLGVADANSQKEICLAILNPKIPEGSRITLVAAGKPQNLAEAIVQKRLSGSCSRNPDTSESTSFYLLKVVKGEPLVFDESGLMPPRIAIFGSRRDVKLARSVVSVDLNGDGRTEHFRKCTSSEGLRLTVWSGRPLTGKRVWDWYYYLGYDVVPTCKKNDYQK